MGSQQAVLGRAGHPHVLSVGPFDDDRKIAVYGSHQASDGSYQQTTRTDLMSFA
ncbi:hypothetical protein MPER_11978, partial [Moniliophthora perniciosa FA553]